MNFLKNLLQRRGKGEEMSDTWLIVGLGNPGPEYEKTRHNIGQMVVDELAREVGGGFKKHGRARAQVLEGRLGIGGPKVVLAKPLTYMNTSGGPVKQLMNAYGVDAAHLVVIHDELDIDPGTVRVKFGGGHAGHNGLRSICDKIGTRDWYRVRVGIGRPPGRMNVADYVLSLPKKEAAEDFEYAVGRGSQAALYLIEHGLEKTQQAFN